MTSPSELATLVETEARLDRALADARARAAGVIEDARRRGAAIEASLQAALAEECARVATAATAASAAQRLAIASAARAEIARFDALRDEALAPLASALAARLVALAREGPP